LEKTAVAKAPPRPTPISTPPRPAPRRPALTPEEQAAVERGLRELEKAAEKAKQQ
jgi:hypothetical protein